MTAPASQRPIALVTGASAGLGRVYADRLAARGFDLVLVARDAARLEAFAAELAARYGIAAEPFPADLATHDGMDRTAARIAQLDRLVLLVNNAGFGTKGKLVNRPVEEQAAMIELHAMAPMRLTHAALPGMLARKRGGFINIASVASFVWSAGNVNYCATKAFLRVFSEGLATELRGTGLRVQACCPGFTYTEFHDRGKMRRETIPKMLWLPAERIVDESLEAYERGGPVTFVPTRRFRWIATTLRFAPFWLMRRMVGRYGKMRT